jgi:hypothetical protein
VKNLFVLILLFSANVSAEFINCQDAIGKYGNLGEMRYQIGEYKRGGTCFVSIGPNNRYPLYRSYTFGSQGELMVFNSLGRGAPSKDTGARNFHFPALSHKLAFELDYEKEFIRIKSTDGRTWTFDARSSKIHNIEKMKFVEDSEVSRTNNGGIELSPTLAGTIVDEGWRVGGLPNTVLKRSSTIKDSFGNICRIKNKKLFKLILDQNGDVDGAQFIHNSRDKWLKFLTKECRDIKL